MIWLDFISESYFYVPTVIVFLLLTSNKFISKSKNEATKKLCGGAVALKIPRKLTCNSWFCNAGGCKTLISIELGCSPGKFTWKVEGEQCCKSQLIKVINWGKPPCMFSLACNLMISDQIREQLVQIPWNIFISKNYLNDISNDQISKMITNDTREYVTMASQRLLSNLSTS